MSADTGTRQLPGKSAGQMADDEARSRDAQIITERCLLCPEWSYTGPADDAREEAIAHRRTEHPKAERARVAERRKEAERIEGLRAGRDAAAAPDTQDTAGGPVGAPESPVAPDPTPEPAEAAATPVRAARRRTRPSGTLERAAVPIVAAAKRADRLVARAADVDDPAVGEAIEGVRTAMDDLVRAIGEAA